MSNLRLVREDENLEGIIDSDRYDVKKVLGQGTWGTVYLAHDSATDRDVALKILNPSELARQQMKHRKLAPWEPIDHEGDIEACAHIVPRSFEIDNKGIPFIRMPVYATFLDRRIGDDTPGAYKTYLGQGLDLKNILGSLSDIARGIDEMHSVRGRVHSDIKPDNIAIDKSGKLLLNDLGTSTCASLGWTESPRDNMGFVYTRAPECFYDGSHPGRRSDVWSFGAIAYRMITGEYPLESEFKQNGNPEEFVRSHNSKALNKIIRKKIRKNVPARLRPLLRKALNVDTSGRYENGRELVQGVERTRQYFNVPGEIGRALKKWGAWTTAATITGLASYMLYTADRGVDLTPEPKVHGVLYLGANPDEEPIAFVAEDIQGLPPAASGFMLDGTNPHARAVTDDRNVASLVDSHAKTVLTGGAFGARANTKYQERIYQETTTPLERREFEGKYGHPNFYAVSAKSIEDTIQKLKVDGNVDLEDLCVMSRLGPEVLEKAKASSGSNEFRDYIKATDSKGDYIINSDEREFIQQWLSYIHH